MRNCGDVSNRCLGRAQRIGNRVRLALITASE
jgi:hypothetical protein